MCAAGIPGGESALLGSIAQHPPESVNALVHVEWALGSPGVRPRAVTLQQLLDLTEPGEQLLLAPGLYRSDAPLRWSKPLVVCRDPAFGSHVAPHPLAGAWGCLSAS